MTLTPDLLRRIRRIELRSRRLVQNAFAGAYHSIYKGRGLSFAAVRPYIPGDDIRHIDWKVTARTGQPFIKQFVEERELTLMLVIDSSPSVLFGTQDQQKRDLAAELGAVLAYTATVNNDKAGLIIFSDHIEHYIPPKKGRSHIQRLIRDVLTIETSGRGTDLSLALRTTNRMLSQGAIVFLLSDFMLDADQYRPDLTVTGKRHDTTAIVLSDPLEEAIPDVGLLGLQDAESGDVQWVDSSSEGWQQGFFEQRDQLRSERDAALRGAGVPRIDVPPDGDYVRALTHYFGQRVVQQR